MNFILKSGQNIQYFSEVVANILELFCTYKTVFLALLILNIKVLSTLKIIEDALHSSQFKYSDKVDFLMLKELSTSISLEFTFSLMFNRGWNYICAYMPRNCPRIHFSVIYYQKIFNLYRYFL